MAPSLSSRYNKADHPIAFHKGDMFASSKRKIADQGPAPDNEDVFEVSRDRVRFALKLTRQEDEAVPDDEEEKPVGEDDEVNDVSKDKLIKEVKPKGKSKEGKETKGKKK